MRWQYALDSAQVDDERRRSGRRSTNIQRHRTNCRIDAKARCNGKLETYLIDLSNSSTYLVLWSACSSDTLKQRRQPLLLQRATDSRTQDRVNNDDNCLGRVKNDNMMGIEE
jgi:hypothetical protein